MMGDEFRKHILELIAADEARRESLEKRLLEEWEQSEETNRRAAEAIKRELYLPNDELLLPPPS